MAVSIKNQILHAISDNKLIGASKHSLKGKGQAYKGKILSYSTLNARKDVAKSFSKWLSQNYREIRLAKDINSSVVQEWLNDCATSGKCSTDTLKSYKSQMIGIANNINDTYHSNIDLKTVKVPQGYNTNAVRCSPMKQADLQVLKRSYKPFSTGYNALVLAESGGLRCEEICHLQNRDIQVINSSLAYVHIDCGKGGRNRDIKVTNPKHIQSLISLKNHLGSNLKSRPCPVTKKSLLSNLERHMKSTYISKDVTVKSQYQNQAYHSIRKMFAQNEYDKCRNSGMSKKESFQFVTQQLGHNRIDSDLMNRYIANQW